MTVRYYRERITGESDTSLMALVSRAFCAGLAFLCLLVLSVFCSKWWLDGWCGGRACNLQLGYFTGIAGPLLLF